MDPITIITGLAAVDALRGLFGDPDFVARHGLDEDDAAHLSGRLDVAHAAAARKYAREQAEGLAREEDEFWSTAAEDPLAAYDRLQASSYLPQERKDLLRKVLLYPEWDGTPREYAPPPPRAAGAAGATQEDTANPGFLAAEGQSGGTFPQTLQYETPGPKTHADEARETLENQAKTSRFAEEVEDPSTMDYIDQAIKGGNSMYNNYSDMKEAWFKNSDKYFHCKGNCEAAQHGPGGQDAAETISTLREAYGQFKGDPVEDMIEYMIANEHGSKAPKGEDCKEHCKKFRPNKLPDKY